MNLIQRMVAENRQTVTCTEIADELQVSRADFWAWMKEHEKYFKRFGPLGETLNSSQALFACGMNPYDSDIAWELAKSAHLVLLTSRYSHLEQF